jgi:hypothetical protein
MRASQISPYRARITEKTRAGTGSTGNDVDADGIFCFIRLFFESIRLKPFKSMQNSVDLRGLVFGIDVQVVAIRNFAITGLVFSAGEYWGIAVGKPVDRISSSG